VNELFSSKPRESDGHEKWIDFAAKFWHCECICKLTPKVFTERYRKWCKRSGYYFSPKKASAIYESSCGHLSVMPKNEITELLITQTIGQLNAITQTLATILSEMKHLAKMLPEYSVVSGFMEPEASYVLSLWLKQVTLLALLIKAPWFAMQALSLLNTNPEV